MPRVKVAALLGALVIVAGSCRLEPPDRSAGADARANPQEDSSMTATRPDSLRLEIDVPPEVRTDEPVPIVLRVRNVGRKSQELYLMGRPIAFDITITRADGSVVWRRLEGHTIPAILRIEVLPAGGVLELADTWNQRTDGGAQAGPGVYRVQGALPTDAPAPLETPPASLRVSAQ